MAPRPVAPGAARPALPAALALAGLLLAPAQVAAHGFLERPRPRNLYAADEGKWWVPASEDATNVPYPEDCPHCMNVSVADPKPANLGQVGRPDD